jgi:hypothetical protein
MPTLSRRCGGWGHVAKAGAQAGVFRDDNSILWDLLSGVMHAAATHLARCPQDHVQVRDETVRIILSALALSPNVPSKCTVKPR